MGTSIWLYIKLHDSLERDSSPQIYVWLQMNMDVADASDHAF